jgi:hypothetical protein
MNSKERGRRVEGVVINYSFCLSSPHTKTL